MHNVIINAALNNRQPFKIGRVDEKDVMQIKFDLNGWIKEFGRGTIALSVLRKKDNNPYPVAISIDENGFATWNITDIETACDGELKAQLTYYVDDKRKKSSIYKLHVSESLAENGEAPDPYESWLEVLQELTAETAANAESARQSAASAGQSASDAEQSKQAAQGYADDASASATAANTSATEAHTSETNAEGWAELAQQVATDNGYAQMYIDDYGTLYLARTTNIVDKLDFILTNDGELEVLIYG